MKLFCTLTGLKHYFGDGFLEPGMKVFLKKEPDNEYDKEAIAVSLPGLGKIGYLANSPYTVVGESWSAGRIYDRIGETAEAKVLYLLDRGVLCEIALDKDALPQNVSQEWIAGCTAAMKQQSSGPDNVCEIDLDAGF